MNILFAIAIYTIDRTINMAFNEHLLISLVNFYSLVNFTLSINSMSLMNFDDIWGSFAMVFS